ncbi:MAG TPA: extracellular solute-binding protein [Polyangiaceae bacterium]|nr:extracellular solute-binding protein [Polyangiaceae bacterium]
MGFIERYPYGKAPFWLTAVAVASMVGVMWTQVGRAKAKPDMVLALSAPNHVVAYRKVEEQFEREHGVDVALQLVNARALTTRLQNAMLAGTEVPDLAELPFDAMRYFGRGPIRDIGFLDLTERLTTEGFRARLVEARLSVWSTRGHVFALPHDVHPVMLGYRADLVDRLGIDVETLKTWDDFTAAGRRVTADLDGDGALDRFMIDLQSAGSDLLTMFLLQRGVGLFDEQGELTFNQPLTIDTLIWYLHQYYGKDRIAYDCGWGQPLAKAMSDGLVLFYIVPDWRAHLLEMESPRVSGKMKLMPLPAWEPGGRRTSVWGGSGLAITKSGKNPELAWQFARQLYFDRSELGKRFSDTSILPALKDAWALPEFSAPSAYFSEQPIGTLYASLAGEVPPLWMNPFYPIANNKLSEAFLKAVNYYGANGDRGLHEFVARELDAAEAYVRRLIARNVIDKM